jgi:RimJ/RimL family protein N-acetyltransferase
LSEIPPARPVRFETARYIVRSIVPDDASESWTRWGSDPEAVRWLNMPAREVSHADLLQYIATFDNRSRFLIGVFEKASGRLIGFNSIYIDWARRAYLINTLIGEADVRHKGARSETRLPIHEYFLETMDLDHSVCMVVEGHRSLALMASWGWEIDGRSEKPSASGGAPVGILHMRLTKDSWRRARAKGQT